MIVNIAPGINHNKLKITQKNLCYARICTLCMIHLELNSYLAEKALCLHYKEKQVNAVYSHNHMKEILYGKNAVSSIT